MRGRLARYGVSRLLAVITVVVLTSTFPVFAETDFSENKTNTFWSQYTAKTLLLRIFEDIELHGQSADILERLEEFIENYPDAEVTDEALVTTADIYIQKRDFDKAAKTYQKLLEFFPVSRHKMAALYGLGYCQYRQGRLSDARVALNSVVANRGGDLRHKARAGIMLEEIASVSWSFSAQEMERRVADAIGVLLPLKGDYAEFGEKALKGVLLAADIFGQERGKVEVVVRDVSEGVRSVDAIVGNLADNKRIKGLVGPLLSSTAIDAAESAQRSRIPMIVLSQREDVPAVGDYVFRNFLISSQQAAAVAQYAYDYLGARKFAVLYPKNSYGSDLAEHFANKVRKLGGEVVREMSYEPGKTDFGQELQFFFDIEVEEHREGRRQIREYTHGVQVDALFIPDYYSTVGIIAPYLAYYNIEDITLLGANGWNSPKLAELAGRHVEGAVFVDGFFARSRRAATQRFTRRFTEIYGTEPGLLEAQAYDATMLLLSVIRQGAEGRDNIKDMLFRTYDFEGAAGDITFDYDGESLKELFVLTVERGRITELDWPGRSPRPEPVIVLPPTEELWPDGDGQMGLQGQMGGQAEDEGQTGGQQPPAGGWPGEEQL